MRFSILAVLCVGVILNGCASNASSNLSRLDFDIFRDNQTDEIFFVGRPTKIIDGDTIVLAHTIKIRMSGIDTPESKQMCNNENGDEYACGRAATEHLRQITGDGRVKCKMIKYEKYGRNLMTCYTTDDTDIQAQMVRDGYAVVSPYEPDTYRDDETNARAAKQGIWVGKFLHPHCVRHQKKQDGKFKNLCRDKKYYTGWENKFNK